MAVSPARKNPRVVAPKPALVKKDLYPHEHEFFEQLRNHFNEDLPQKDVVARGVILRTLRDIAKQSLPKDLLQITKTKIIVKDEQISLIFPPTLTAKFSLSEQEISELFMSKWEEAENIWHTLEIVYAK